MKGYRFLLTTLALLLVGTTFANNLQITNISKTGNDIQFDIAWENSWYISNAPYNWDAVWVFIKTQDCDATVKAWEHVKVSTSSGDHTAGSGLQIDAASDGMGVFIRRSSIGVGTIPATTITLQLQSVYGASYVFEVMGIEMAAVLEGSFQTGGVGTSDNGFKKVSISSEAQIAQATLYNGSSANSSNPTIPAAFPKGYNKFYAMKYEVTQEQYTRFLNLLSFGQQVARTQWYPISPRKTNALATDGSPSSSTGILHRNGIQIKTPIDDIASPTIYECNLNNNNTFGESDDGRSVACNFLKWTDLLAYLDWAALRPMTELEYEKACRGFTPVSNDEYAWGNTNYTAADANGLTNPMYDNEVSTASVVAGVGLGALEGGTGVNYGPLRAGFAATASSTRENAGASYWGILELTGNVWEQTVSAGYNNSNISAFTGVLGDGELNTFGEADATGWDLNPNKSIVRGGSWKSPMDMYSVVGASCTTFDYSGSSSSYYIKNFTLSTLNNNSNDAPTGYTDYTNSVAPAALTVGQSYTANITSGVSNSYQNAAIWIDYDDDGVFSTGERVAYINYQNMNTPRNFSAFTVQNYPGVHRMRVMYKYGSSSTYYGSNMVECIRHNNNSEVEDYLVNVGGGGGISVARTGSRAYTGDTSFNLDRHSETGGRGVRQF